MAAATSSHSCGPNVFARNPGIRPLWPRPDASCTIGLPNTTTDPARRRRAGPPQRCRRDRRTAPVPTRAARLRHRGRRASPAFARTGHGSGATATSTSTEPSTRTEAARLGSSRTRAARAPRPASASSPIGHAEVPVQVAPPELREVERKGAADPHQCQEHPRWARPPEGPHADPRRHGDGGDRPRERAGVRGERRERRARPGAARCRGTAPTCTRPRAGGRVPPPSRARAATRLRRPRPTHRRTRRRRPGCNRRHEEEQGQRQVEQLEDGDDGARGAGRRGPPQVMVAPRAQRGPEADVQREADQRLELGEVPGRGEQLIGDHDEQRRARGRELGEAEIGQRALQQDAEREEPQELAGVHADASKPNSRPLNQ